jgi:hypothetical protein
VTVPELDFRWFSEESLTEFMSLREISEALWISCGKLLRAITKQEVEGRLLQRRTTPGDLSDCRKLYFDETPDNPRPGWRIVFRFRPDDRNRVQVQIIAIGPRRDLEVYETAVERLGR